MTLHFLGASSFPAYLALSSDIVDGKIAGASAIGRTIYLTDTSEWKIIEPDLSLSDYFQGGGSSTPSAPSMTNSNVSPTTSNVSAAVATRYFANLSGLTADRNFILPTCSAGNEIELKITAGNDNYELIIVGDANVSIEGGSVATEWSRLFITGEIIRFVADGANSWRVVYDGRIPCAGLMTLSTNDTTNSAATNTLPTWDNAIINVGNICDLTNYRFNIRRAGFYTVTGVYNPAATLSSGNYVITAVYLNGTSGILVGEAYRQAGGTNNLDTVALPAKTHLCTIGDNLGMYYRTQAVNKGALAGATWFQVKEA